jgi:hypothetical protein
MLKEVCVVRDKWVWWWGLCEGVVLRCNAFLVEIVVRFVTVGEMKYGYTAMRHAKCCHGPRSFHVIQYHVSTSYMRQHTFHHTYTLNTHMLTPHPENLTKEFRVLQRNPWFQTGE